jgi:hypothetical protein
MDVQATGEAYRPQKITSSTSKEKFNYCLYFSEPFLPFWILIQIRIVNPDPGIPLNPDSIRIRIHNTAKKLDIWL